MVGRWVTLERGRRQAVREGRPDPREMEAEITALRRRVRQLEKERACSIVCVSVFLFERIDA